MKRRLSQREEFEIMKLVLDKFLLLGFGILGLAVYSIFTETIAKGIILMVVGIVILLVFMALLVREYEFMK
jgi:hypothetical protein